MAAALDRAISTTDLGLAATPRWWSRTLQALLAATMVVGALWLVALYALTVLHLPSPNRLPSGRCRYYGTPDRRLLAALQRR